MLVKDLLEIKEEVNPRKLLLQAQSRPKRKKRDKEVNGKMDRNPSTQFGSGTLF